MVAPCPFLPLYQVYYLDSTHISLIHYKPFLVVEGFLSSVDFQEKVRWLALISNVMINPVIGYNNSSMVSITQYMVKRPHTNNWVNI